MTLDQLQAQAHKAGIENQNAWTDLQAMERTLIVLRQKQQQAALAALHAQIALEAAQGKQP